MRWGPWWLQSLGLYWQCCLVSHISWWDVLCKEFVQSCSWAKACLFWAWSLSPYLSHLWGYNDCGWLVKGWLWCWNMSWILSPRFYPTWCLCFQLAKQDLEALCKSWMGPQYSPLLEPEASFMEGHTSGPLLQQVHSLLLSSWISLGTREQPTWLMYLFAHACYSKRSGKNIF